MAAGPLAEKAAEVGVSYLAKQSFTNVLLAVILLAVIVGAWYGVPWAVRETKSGLKEVMDDCAMHRKEAEKLHAEEVRGLQQTFKETLDRIQGLPLKKVAAQTAAKDDGG